MSDLLHWRPARAWPHLSPHHHSAERPSAPDIRVDLLDVLPTALVIVRAERMSQFEDRMKRRFGRDIPPFGHASIGQGMDLIWSAPGQWLVIGMEADDLSNVLADVAAVTDQSDSRAFVRLSGLRVRDALAKGFAIDLHPSVFSIGSTAVTQVAHLSVQIWQVDGTPTYMVAVPRSFAGSFWAWLESACAEFSIQINDMERVRRLRADQTAIRHGYCEERLLSAEKDGGPDPGSVEYFAGRPNAVVETSRTRSWSNSEKIACPSLRRSDNLLRTSLRH